MQNPYQAPLADVDCQPLAAGADVAEPGGLFARIGAHLLDTLIMLPVIAFTFWASSLSRSFFAWWVVPGFLISLFYSVYLVQRHGGTPGKRVMQLRIQMADGSPVSARAALVRTSVITALATLSSVAEAMAALSMDDASYLAMGMWERLEGLGAAEPSWQLLVSVLMQVWIWGTLIIMLTNGRRRAPHDFLAGTVVVKG
jgi:uncharacterized RDD family membrane protein YckC